MRSPMPRSSSPVSRSPAGATDLPIGVQSVLCRPLADL
jgi:hypothetical protein